MFELGEWLVPQGYSILISILLLHANPSAFPDPHRFNPERFLGDRTPNFAWSPFGGGTWRCVGASFAKAEMDVVLRTVLRQFALNATTDPGEKMHSRAGSRSHRKTAGASFFGIADVRQPVGGRKMRSPSVHIGCQFVGLAHGASIDALANDCRSRGALTTSWRCRVRRRRMPRLCDAVADLNV